MACIFSYNGKRWPRSPFLLTAMKYKITYLTKQLVHQNPRVGFWFNVESIPKDFVATKIVEYDGEMFDDGWDKLVTEDVIDWEIIQE